MPCYKVAGLSVCKLIQTESKTLALCLEAQYLTEWLDVRPPEELERPDLSEDGLPL